MKQPYSITLAGPTTWNLEKETTCVGVILSLLKREWEKRPYVDLRCFNRRADKDLAPCDFVLAHDWTAGFRLFCELYGKRAKIVSMLMEYVSQLAQVGYVYTQSAKKPWTTVVGIPAALEFLQPTVKEPGSILLDHAWIRSERTPENDWMQEMYAELEQYAGKRRIGQITMKDHDWIPSWIERVYIAPYPTYLNRTAAFENFVVTHRGSFNHSVVDMAVRGMRVVSKNNFCPTDFSALGISILSDARRIHDLLAVPHVAVDVRDRVVDIPALVDRIEDDLLRRLNGCL